MINVAGQPTATAFCHANLANQASIAVSVLCSAASEVYLMNAWEGSNMWVRVRSNVGNAESADVYHSYFSGALIMLV
jgi:hypothetical protein